MAQHWLEHLHADLVLFGAAESVGSRFLRTAHDADDGLLDCAVWLSLEQGDTLRVLQGPIAGERRLGSPLSDRYRGVLTRGACALPCLLLDSLADPVPTSMTIDGRIFVETRSGRARVGRVADAASG